MCGRMTLATDEVELKARFHLDVTGEIVKRYNVYPNHDTYKLPVITEEEPNKISMFYWGIVPVWWTRDERGLINVKYETLRDKKTFHKDLAERRCLVLADGFYEWKRAGKGKVPYRIALKTEEPFAFAGIWSTVHDARGVVHPTFAILTTEANALVAQIHTRMPVILREQDEAAWLNPRLSLDEAQVLLVPLPADRLMMYEVSPKVNSPAFNVPEALQPVA